MATDPALIGTLSQTSATETHLVRDVSSILQRYEPDLYPLDSILRATEMREKAKAVKVEWAARSSWPRKDVVAVGVAAPADHASATWTVANGGNWRVGDVINVPYLSRLDPTTPNMIVGAISGNDLSVHALNDDDGSDNYGQVPAIGAETTIAWIGNSKEEGADASASRGQAPGYQYNYCQILDTVVDITGTRLATQNYTSVNDWDDAVKAQIAEFRKTNEYTLMFGKRGTQTINGAVRKTMGGINSYITASADYDAGQPLSESILLDWVRQAFTGNNGSKTRLFFMDSYLATQVGKTQLSKLRANSPVVVAGVTCEKLTFNGNTLLLKQHRGFNELGYDNFGLIVDPKNIKKVELRPMERNILDYKKQGKDKKGEWYLEEVSVQVTNPSAHLRVRGS